MAANSNGSPFNVTLRDLPLPVRLTLSLFLIAVGLGYFAALLQLHFRDATRGQPLPTPNDMVEIFSGVEGWPVPKPAPPEPTSKLEALIMGPVDEPTEAGKCMAKPFFLYKKATEAEIPEREGERLAIRAWLNASDDQRRKTYENNAFPLPDDFNQTVADQVQIDRKRLDNLELSKDSDKGPGKIYVENGQAKVQSIIKTRCSTCHDSDSNPKGHKQLQDYRDFAEVLVVPTVGRTSRQMSVESLTQTTHLHLLSFCVLWTLTGVIFAFSSYWKWLRCVLAPLVLLAQVADVGCWWLARLPGVGPYFALAIMGTGTVVGIGLALQVVLGLLDMYKRSGRLVLLVLFIGAVTGAALLTPHVQKYLKDEAGPPAPTAPAAAPAADK